MTAPAVPDSGDAPLAVRRLVLTEFRNYRRLKLEVEPRPVVLTGANGAGKTNLLEALSYLAPGRGLRRAGLAQVSRRTHSENSSSSTGNAVWAVSATLAGPQGPVEIGTGREPPPAGDAPAPERRLVRIDGAPAKSQGELARLLSVTWLTPEMDRLFLDAGAARRRFLDRLVYGFIAGHAASVSAYERAMRERTRLLRDGSGDPSWLGALEANMAEAGVALTAGRRQMVARLNQASHKDIGAFPRPAVAVEGTLEEWLEELPALAAEECFRKSLHDSRRRDAEAGGAALGPHRSDLAVRHAARDLPAASCSTGEQKALLIAIVLATARLLALDRGAPPILLLDEVVAHLDETRRAGLFDEICALRAQAWLSGTDRALFAGLEGRAQFMDVEDGEVSPAPTPKSPNAPNAPKGRA
ncbi:MAG: DNA replication/repair protein RecF [Alphaproteobacteria bacterium]